VVRELYGVMAAEGVAGGYVVTSGTFTKDARQFAAGRNVELIDGQGLDALLRDGRRQFVLGLRAVSEVSTYGGHVMDMAGNHR
jgi:restriction system protein